MQSFHRNLFREKLKMRTPKLTKINPASPEQSRREQRRRVILSIYAIGKNSPRIFAFSACSAVRRIGQPDKKMQNEPNFAQRTSSIKYPEPRIDQKMSNEPNLPGGQVAHLINEQRTKNHKQFSNEPNFKITKINVSSLSKMVCANFHPLGHQKNEPNTNPIQTNRLLFWPAVRILSTYSGQGLA